MDAWVCALIKPGTANFPLPSMTVSAAKSALSPTFAIFAPSIAISVSFTLPSGKSTDAFLMSVFMVVSFLALPYGEERNVPVAHFGR